MPVDWLAQEIFGANYKTEKEVPKKKTNKSPKKVPEAVAQFLDCDAEQSDDYQVASDLDALYSGNSFVVSSELSSAIDSPGFHARMDNKKRFIESSDVEDYDPKRFGRKNGSRLDAGRVTKKAKKEMPDQAWWMTPSSEAVDDNRIY